MGMSDTRSHLRLPLGLLGTVALILFAEGYFHLNTFKYTNTATLSWGLSDTSARRDAKDADILCLGDSLVKHGMIPEVLEAKLGQKVYNLSICASSAPATYFIYKHALESGSHPKFIIVDFMPDLLTGSPRHSSRNWPEILTIPELIELSRAGRDFSFFVEMARDQVLTSFRSRWEIRTNITSAVEGKTDPLEATNRVYKRNWTVHRGAEYTPDNPNFKGEVTEKDHFNLMSDRFWCNNVNRSYIHKLMKLAHSKGTKVYWLLPPVSPAIHARRVQSGADAKFSDFIREFSAKYPHLTVLDARRSNYDHTRFVDPVHLNGKGGVALSTEVADIITSGRTEWVWLPRFRPHESPVALEDVDQSRVAVGVTESMMR